MIGTKQWGPWWPNRVEVIATHVFRRRPPGPFGQWDRRVELIVSNAWSFAEVRELLPAAFAEFCGEVAAKIIEYEAEYQRTGRKPDLVDIEDF